MRFTLPLAGAFAGSPDIVAIWSKGSEARYQSEENEYGGQEEREVYVLRRWMVDQFSVR